VDIRYYIGTLYQLVLGHVDFLTNFGELTRTLDADPDYAKNHTRLLLKSKEWEQQKRDDSFLVRGKDLAASEEWLKESENKQPSPTNLQLEYLTASRALPYRKIKLRSVLLTSLGVTIFMFIARLLGFMQPLELAAYDQVARLRPNEPQDERFLMVDVDPESIDRMNENPKYQQGRGSIADARLHKRATSRFTSSSVCTNLLSHPLRYLQEVLQTMYDLKSEH
jgi:hypothetical protein